MTNISGEEILFKCSNDCVQSGCPGHSVKCTYLGVSDVVEFRFSDGHSIYRDRNELKAMIKAWESVDL